MRHLSLLLFFALGITPNTCDRANHIEDLTATEIALDNVDVVGTKKVLKTKDLAAYLEAVGKRESGGRYDIVNTYGMMGKYQFSRRTLNIIGFRHVSSKKFLSSPKIQEKAMIRLLEHNKHLLRRQWKYIGKMAYGIQITESGMLAAAHLLGASRVRKFLRNGKIYKDGYGTPITEYLALFGGYNTTQIIAKR